MTIRDRVRQWLGFEETIRELRHHADISNTEHLGLVTILKDLSQEMERIECKLTAQSTAILKLSEGVQRIEGKLDGLRADLQEKHVTTRLNQPMSYDWEQVQLQQLAEMLANPPKEEM